MAQQEERKKEEPEQRLRGLSGQVVWGTGPWNKVYRLGRLGWDTVSRGQDTEGLES